MKNTFSIIMLAIVLTMSATLSFGQTPEANPTCSDVGYNRSVKIDNAPFATTVNVTGFGSITTTVSNGNTLSWQSTPAFVKAVILKGGADATVKHYNPVVWFDNNITTPVNSSGNPAAISHVEFCYHLSPSAASVVLSGRVLNRYNRAISGEGYVLTPTARGYTFGSQFLSVMDNVTGFDFLAQ